MIESCVGRDGGTMERELFFQQLTGKLHRFVACGNKLGIVPLTLAGYPQDADFRQDPKLRRFLAQWGNEGQLDSAMVLTGDPTKLKGQGYHYKMYVFEPEGKSENGLAGGISTMCGNGVRAVAAFIQKQFPDTAEARIMTLSGLRTVAIEGSLYTVNMGEFAAKSDDLKNYVNTGFVSANDQGEYIGSPIPREIIDKLSSFVDAQTWSIGLNGNRNNDGSIDGEPHVIVEVSRHLFSDINQLRKLAVAVGPLVTKNTKFFPEEINVNFIVVDKVGKELEIFNCTHERNLGDDADHSVTPSCGTGSTVAGGFILERYPWARSTLVHCTGGDLIISKSSSGQELLMKGPAEEVQ